MQMELKNLLSKGFEMPKIEESLPIDMKCLQMRLPESDSDEEEYEKEPKLLTEDDLKWAFRRRDRDA